MMASINVEVQQLRKRPKLDSAISLKFPIKTDEDLANIDADINESNKEEYIAAIKQLWGGRVKKSLEHVVSRALCMEYNTSGTSGKKSIKLFKNFHAVVLASISDNPAEADEKFREALQTVKKRHFRAVSYGKKAEKKTI